MNKQLKNQEKGSVLIEVIAVVALLGVMGPLLFKQVADRNEEVENINIASEMRIIKEAFSSYIMNYHSEISCSAGTCTPNASIIQSYLPMGFEDTISGYDFRILQNQAKQGSSTLQGFIIPKLSTLGLEGLGLKRVARIATLIGADGGILRKGNTSINGTGGAWQLNETETAKLFSTAPGDHYFLATTGIDTYVPTVRYEDFDQSNILLPDQGFASKRLHAWNLFSVGQVDSSASNSCFELKHNSTTTSADGLTTAQSDNIKLPGENGCDPLFWVAAEGDFAGNVFVKNQLHMRSSPTGNTSVLISSEPTTDEKKPTSILIEGTNSRVDMPSINENKKRRIVVYTANGKEALVINGQGEIIARGVNRLDSSKTMSGKDNEVETLTIKNGRIESNEKATNATRAAGSAQAYRVDPSHVSVMGDIRLESRGGARLSDLLPQYQLKEVMTISNIDYNPSTLKTIDMPVCPNMHVPAIVVTPLQWHQPTEKNITDSVINNLVSKESGELEVKPEMIPNAYPILPRVEIIYNSSETTTYYHMSSTNPSSGGSWIVNLSYDQNGTEVTEISTPITALVHTYCVYTGDVGSSYVSDRPNDSSSIVGN